MLAGTSGILVQKYTRSYNATVGQMLAMSATVIGHLVVGGLMLGAAGDGVKVLGLGATIWQGMTSDQRDQFQVSHQCCGFLFGGLFKFNCPKSSVVCGQILYDHFKAVLTASGAVSVIVGLLGTVVVLLAFFEMYQLRKRHPFQRPLK